MALNCALRRQRRRLVVFAAILALAGAVLAAHGMMAGDHMGDGVMMCLAVAESAVAAVGMAIVIAALAIRPLWRLSAPTRPAQPVLPLCPPGFARAGPPALQVFRL